MGQEQSANYRVHIDGTWRGSWTESRKSQTHRQIIAASSPEADALETLLTHYPWIVYVGVSFWRKLLVRVWFGLETTLENQLPELVRCTPESPPTPAPPVVNEKHHARRFGICGLIKKSSPSLPKSFMSHDDAEGGGVGKAVDVTDSVKEFINGLLMADQIDVVDYLIVQFQLDPCVHFLQASTFFLESSGFQLIPGYLPPHSHLPVMLLRRWCHPSRYDSINLSKLFTQAAQAGYCDLMSALLGEPFNVDAATAHDGEPEGDRASSIQWAAGLGQVEAVKLLLRIGLSPDGEENTKEAPLHCACESGLGIIAERNHAQVVQVLLERGANVNVRDVKMGATPLINAARTDQLEIVKILLKNGATLNATTNEGSSALHHAAVAGLEVLSLLLNQADIQINLQNNDGETPLHFAASKGGVEHTASLLEAGALVNLADTQSGATPLHHAAKEGHSDVVSLLLRHPKIDLNIRDKQGNTALDNAKEGPAKDEIAKEVERRQTK